ncbi:MAG: ATPase component of ABC-type transport system (duplicated ATPase domain) [Solidesulfovibrio magneticus str. Maddingley MBC34]|uniref:ATPase component of ABC-type transport system (Duplicated ATPase domain) n=1 Tax=Solidesulfovibrio magneticus str. Maddingley MBC34 TaxID=1206767 RepID=K6GW15_9BACT|nr:MAG: ATPase component of ABC-type transport system (duplicated ATPase domain) [Solidesulfovibrio magneticus str. Maddingley MBC34]
MIELENVSFVPAGASCPTLAEATLRIGQGERVGIVGPSGSGKSTLGYHLCGAHKLALAGRTDGRLAYAGRDGTDGAPIGFAGLVGQNPEAQLFCRTVYDELALALLARGEDETRCRQTAETLLGRYGFADRSQASLGSLSLGQKQLTAVLSMLAMEPRVLLLDEPTSYLDAAAADRLFAHLTELSRENGWIILVIEHDRKRLAGFADRLIALDGGRIVHDGPASAGETRDAGVSEAEDWAEALAALPPFSPPSLDAAPLVELHGLRFGYTPDAPILDGLDLAVRPGEVVALLGANGAGKSTLLRLIKGLGKPAPGRVALRAGLTAAHDVGLMFQNPEEQIFAHTVAAECGYWLENRGVEPEERLARCRAALAGFGLGDLLDRAPFSLSFGEKRRLCLAAILVAEPAVLCLDEPTTGLDAANMAAMAAEVRRQAVNGRAVLLATHEEAFAAMAATRWVTLANGRVASDRPNPWLAP